MQMFFGEVDEEIEMRMPFEVFDFFGDSSGSSFETPLEVKVILLVEEEELSVLAERTVVDFDSSDGVGVLHLPELFAGF